VAFAELSSITFGIVRRTDQLEVPVIYIGTSPNSIEAFRLPFEAEKCKKEKGATTAK
jgi:hypothetical protein